MNVPPPHTPIMIEPILSVMGGCDVVLDATFGAGGHSRALLEQNPSRQIYAMDQDPGVAVYATALAQEYAGHLVFVHGNFSAMIERLAELGVSVVDGILMDIGVSSMQLDQPERGFSFLRDGALDMRMAQTGRSAAEVVNEESLEELTRIIRCLGEESMARVISRNIVRHRARGSITSTTQLARIIHEVKQRRGARIDPATQTFQALRIHVNDELGALEAGLKAAEAILRPGGVLAVLAFHSLEDRIVKRFFKQRSDSVQNSRHLPPRPVEPRRFELLQRRPLTAAPQECLANSRARSAKLRMARKIGESLC